MATMNRLLCKLFITRGKYLKHPSLKKSVCDICVVRNQSVCPNLKIIQQQEDREWEERVDKFDETRTFAQEGVEE